MSNTLLDLAHRLAQEREAFVLATVVWCERPTSAKPGAQALIRSDGQMNGWIGGSCTQPVVLREALRALHEGRDPYLLRIGSAGADMQREDVTIFPMSCTSGGALDIYMEPHLPNPQLLLVGDSPVIAALSELAPTLNFAVTQLNSADLTQVQIDERTCVLVATHGLYDEDVLEHALRSPASYVGLVASRKRAEACRNYLRMSGLTEAQVERLNAPAGLDLGAKTSEEIAASILAELVQVRRSRVIGKGNDSTEPEDTDTALTASDTAVDLVCGMIVETVNARHHSTYEGREYYFCCPACKRLFEGNQQKYLA